MLTRRRFVRDSAGLALSASIVPAMGVLSGCSRPALSSPTQTPTNSMPDNTSGGGNGSPDGGVNANLSDGFKSPVLDQSSAGNVPSNYTIAPSVASDGQYDYFASCSFGGLCRAKVGGSSTELLVEGERQGENSVTQTLFTYLNLDGDTLYYLRIDNIEGANQTETIHSVQVDGSNDVTLYTRSEGDSPQMRGLYLYGDRLYVIMLGSNCWEVWSMEKDGSGRQQICELTAAFSEHFFLGEDGLLVEETGYKQGDSLVLQPLDGSDAQVIYQTNEGATLGIPVVLGEALYVSEYDSDSKNSTVLRIGTDGKGIQIIYSSNSGADLRAVSNSKLVIAGSENPAGDSDQATYFTVLDTDSGRRLGEFTLTLQDGYYIMLGVVGDRLLVVEDADDYFSGLNVYPIDYKGNKLGNYVSWNM